MRWALRATTLDQHHVGSHRADHGPKHEPGEDLELKGNETAAVQKPLSTLSKCICNGDRRQCQIVLAIKPLTEKLPLPKS